MYVTVGGIDGVVIECGVINASVTVCCRDGDVVSVPVSVLVFFVANC